jgi:hypothetical protein
MDAHQQRTVRVNILKALASARLELLERRAAAIHRSLSAERHYRLPTALLSVGEWWRHFDL